MSKNSHSSLALRLEAAVYREAVALAVDGVASPADIDSVITKAIGRRWAVGGPFEIWEQIGWDLVQVIAGELYPDISTLDSLPNVSFELSEDEPDSSGPSDGYLPKFQQIAVIGAGLMGHGIALEFAAHGRHVTLHDISEDLLKQAISKARVGLSALASSGRINESDIEPALARISTSTDLRSTVEHADLVIEAASENIDLKKQIFSEISDSAPNDAVLASNSSTFVPDTYGVDVANAERLLGIHYYNPPHLLPGVELVIGRKTSPETAELVKSEYRAIGKSTSIVQNEPQGFVGNRLQVALLREAMSIVEGGMATASEVDKTVREGFGKRLSEIGIFESVARNEFPLTSETAEAIVPNLCNDKALPRLLLEKIEAGHLGVKVGTGFYDWTPESAESWRANMAESLLEMTTRDQ